MDKDCEIIMVELFEQDIRTNERQSSKGNQLKWENAGIWYKADFIGYEGLAEYIISHLLCKTTLSDKEFVLYDLEEIHYNTSVYKGVKSKNFLKEDWQIVTLERLFRNFFNRSLYYAISKIEDYQERLQFLVSQVERITGLREFGPYMNKLLTIDAIFLNEDRHTHNIAVLMNGQGKFDYCPIFDNGAGLMADTSIDYPIQGETAQFMDQVSARTICPNFEEQLQISEKLYGRHLKFSFSEKYVEELLSEATIYSSEERNRVKEIIYRQMERYSHLFQ